jgi:hypothetical protein
MVRKTIVLKLKSLHHALNSLSIENSKAIKTANFTH